ncbi:PPE family protein [Mycobacterium haemophilum]|uniref:PPE family protein n=4 Tax=Mycobacterium haemophilum TaxID=29311 RepID=UPI000655D442|nr:PPE family protein [Mycobacterium haemophilum]MCV7340558.1 PPE family protein [Mycobacterium haemophilum DSM 44634]
MDFGALPPEVNSGRMYSGVGSAPMMAAASAWNALAAELNSVAMGYEQVVTALSSEEWLGPASASMAEAVTPYLAWINATAAQAEQAAMQARAAAAAFEAAFASVVPPPLIAANRAEVAQLLSSNVLGQNTGAIAALEAQYGQMWAQDAAAMYSYAGSSATASAVTPFTAAPQITSPAAQDVQMAAASAATGTWAGTAQQTLNSLLTQITSTLSSLAAPITQPIQTELGSLGSSTSPLSPLWQILFGTTTFPSSLEAFLTAYTPYASFFYNTEGLPYFSVGMANNFVQTAKTVGLIGGAAPAAGAGGAAKGLGGLGGLLGGGGGGGPISAGLGNAASVGRLSVPSVWSGPLPGAHAPAPLPISTINAAPESGGAGNLLGGMPLAGMGAGAAGSGPRYGFRPTVMARPPFAG